jgi:hypothetical protein
MVLLARLMATYNHVMYVFSNNERVYYMSHCAFQISSDPVKFPYPTLDPIPVHHQNIPSQETDSTAVNPASNYQPSHSRNLNAAADEKGKVNLALQRNHPRRESDEWSNYFDAENDITVLELGSITELEKAAAQPGIVQRNLQQQSKLILMNSDLKILDEEKCSLFDWRKSGNTSGSGLQVKSPLAETILTNADSNEIGFYLLIREFFFLNLVSFIRWF